MMATYIKGETPFPEFSVYLTLDDVVILHFDSEEAEISHIDTHEGSGTKFNAEELSYFRTYVNGSLKNSASYLKNHFNDSKGMITGKRDIVKPTEHGRDIGQVFQVHVGSSC